jgi:hypothetical protein
MATLRAFSGISQWTSSKDGLDLRLTTAMDHWKRLFS